MAQATVENAQLRRDVVFFSIADYDGRNSFNGNEKVVGLTVAAGVTTIRASTFKRCLNLASLGGLREGVRTIYGNAFYGCLRITSLLGLPNSLEVIANRAFGRTRLGSRDGLPTWVSQIGTKAFTDCADLTSIGPGFSPRCKVHSSAFDDCPALLAAAQAKGFATAIEWGKHHWLYRRPTAESRLSVISSVRQTRRTLPPLLSPSSLLERISFLCDDLVREVVEFVG